MEDVAGAAAVSLKTVSRVVNDEPGVTPATAERVRRAIADLRRVLAPDGAAFFECDPPQVESIATLLAPLGSVDVVQDLAGLDRVVRVVR